MLLNISMGIRRYVARLMYLYPRVGNFRMPNYDNAVSGVFGSDFKPNFFFDKKGEFSRLHEHFDLIFELYPYFHSV